MLENKDYTEAQESIAQDPNIEMIAKKILPLFKVVYYSWGKFKPDVIKRQSTSLPAAYISRFGVRRADDISGNSQEVLIQYAIAAVLYDDPRNGDINAIYTENQLIQVLQDYSHKGLKIGNIQSSDISTEEMLKNQIRIMMVGFEVPFLFEPQDTALNNWLNGGGHV